MLIMGHISACMLVDTPSTPRLSLVVKFFDILFSFGPPFGISLTIHYSSMVTELERQ